jgi:hypothetical protein
MLAEDEAILARANQTAGRRADTTPLTAKLPPVIRIAGPAGGAHVSTAEVTIDYAWRSPSGQPVERIDVLIDGRPVKEVGLPLRATAGSTEKAGSLSVSVPPRNAEVALIAWSGDLASEAVRMKLIWSGAAAPDSHNRRLYALAIGVSDYVAPDMALTYAAKDARDFAHDGNGEMAVIRQRLARERMKKLTALLDLLDKRCHEFNRLHRTRRRSRLPPRAPLERMQLDTCRTGFGGWPRSRRMRSIMDSSAACIILLVTVQALL